MNTSDTILQTLMQACKENEILPGDIDIGEHDDLFEYGVVDSMGLTILSCTVEEEFGVELAPDLLVAELRTPRSIANYILANRIMDKASGKPELFLYS